MAAAAWLWLASPVLRRRTIVADSASSDRSELSSSMFFQLSCLSRVASGRWPGEIESSARVGAIFSALTGIESSSRGCDGKRSGARGVGGGDRRRTRRWEQAGDQAQRNGRTETIALAINEARSLGGLSWGDAGGCSYADKRKRAIANTSGDRRGTLPHTLRLPAVRAKRSQRSWPRSGTVFSHQHGRTHDVGHRRMCVMFALCVLSASVAAFPRCAYAASRAERAAQSKRSNASLGVHPFRFECFSGSRARREV